METELTSEGTETLFMRLSQGLYENRGWMNKYKQFDGHIHA